MEIKATPLSHSKKIEFDVNKVKQVYHGRLDNCRCGCAGEYYQPGVTPKADAFITKALEILNKYSNSPHEQVSYDRFTYKDPHKTSCTLKYKPKHATSLKKAMMMIMTIGKVMRVI